MICEYYKKRELHEMDELTFQEHLQECAVCQEMLKQDAELQDLARTLNQPVRAPLLWARIENQIREESRTKQPASMSFTKGWWTPIWRIAAAVLIAFGLTLTGYFLYDSDEVDSSNLLAGEALQQVEDTERAYIDAIDRLEIAATPQMQEMDTELTLLYRDRLATIDAQIERCREALADNPRNAHIRRYLLLALQDKKNTLSEILEANSPIL